MPVVPRIEPSTERAAGAVGAFINPAGNISRAFGEGVGEAQSRVGEAQQQAGRGMQAMGAGMGREGEGLIAKGAGEGKIGAALESVGDTLAKQANLLQDRHNQALATDLFIQWDKEVSMESVKFRSLQGMQAVDALPKYMAKVEEIRNKYGRTAPNIEVARLFDLDSKRRAGYMITDGAYYAGNQNKQYNIAASQARQVTAIANAGNARDDEEFKNEVVSAIRGVNAEAVELGWSPEVTSVKRMQAVSKAWSQRLDTIAMTDPFRAQDLYEKNKGQIADPQVRMHIEKNLIQQYNSVGTRFDADSIANGTPFKGFPRVGGGTYREAIASIEEGKAGYQSIGPVIPSGRYAGDQALGRYQVMGKNLPEWSKEVFGREVSKEEFLASEEIQDKLFDAKFGQLVEKYGNPIDAASAWFTGRPLKQAIAEGAKDVNIGVQEYARRFSNALGPDAAGPLTTESGPDWLKKAIDRAKAIAQVRAPDNPAYEDMLVARVKNEYNNVKTVKNSVDTANYFTMVGALMKVDDTGKPAINNMSQIMDDPTLNAAFNALPPPRQKAVMAQVERNAKADVPLNDQRLQRFNEVMGLKVTAPEQFRELDVMSEDLPRSMKNQLFAAQRAQQKNEITDPGFQRAIHSVQGLLNDADVGQSASDKTRNARYNQFIGAFQVKREEWFKEKGKYPEIEDNRKIAAQLLTDTERPGRFFGTNTMPQFEVPEFEVAKIREAFKAKGRPNPTDREIYEIYQKAQSRGK